MSNIKSKINLCLAHMPMEDELQLIQRFEDDDFDRDEYNIALQSYFDGTKWTLNGVEYEGYGFDSLPDLQVGKILPSYHEYLKTHGSFNGCKVYLFHPPNEADLVTVSDTMLTIMVDPAENVLFWNVDCG